MRTGLPRGIVPSMDKSSRTIGWPLLWASLLLVFWFTRIWALDAFPPFVDEGVHLAFGELVQNQGLLARAEEGRQFTIWLFVAAQAQRSGDPLFTARVATLLVVLPGIAAAVGTARLLANRWSGVLAALLLTFSTYLFFFDRLALADPFAASAIGVSIYFGARLRVRTHAVDALLCGFALFIAVGAKLSALPYLVVPVVAAVTLKSPGSTWRDNVRWAIVALLCAGGLIGVYFAVTFLKGSNPLFHMVNPGSLGQGSPWKNLQLALDTMQGYAGTIMAILVLASVPLLVLRRKFYLPLVLLIPFIPLLLSSRNESRYFLPPMGILLVCGAVATGYINRRYTPLFQRLSLTIILIWIALVWFPFAAALIQDPAALPLPDRDRGQYITSDASGFGLAEARAVLVSEEAEWVIGLLANCQSLKALAADLDVNCPRLNPNGEDVPALEALLEASQLPGIYVVLEDLPYAPASSPGQLIAEIEGAPGRPLLRVYALGE